MTIIKTSCMASHALTILLAVVVMCGTVSKVWAQEPSEGAADTGTEHIEEASGGPVKAYIALAAALTMAVSCIAAGYAVAKIGAAAMGAASEKPEILGRAMLFVAIAEGIAIYGLIIAVFILGKI